MANKKSSSSKSSSAKKPSSSSKSSSARAQSTAKKQAVAYAKNHKKLVAVAACIIAVILIAAIIILFVVKPPFIKKLFEKEEKPNVQISEGDLTEIKEAGFSIHFMQLGNKANGDSILIDCGDTEVLIDAGSEGNSAEYISQYIDQYCTDGTLEYVISTHGDSDHITAFAGNKKNGKQTGILYNYKVNNFIKFNYSNKEGKDTYETYMTAVNYAVSQGANLYLASQCYNETDGAKRQYFLDAEHKISLNILYNYYYFNSTKENGTTADENDFSVVVLLTQETENGKKNYLFTGDLEEDGEKKMTEYYSVSSNSKSEYDVLPEVDLYKAGHHGSKTSSTPKLLSMIKPKYVVACCCCGAPEYTVNVANTFPTQIMIDNVAPYTDKVYCTSLATGLPDRDSDDNSRYVSRSYGGWEPMNGNIVFYTKGNEISLYCSNSFKLLKDWDWFKENRICPKVWEQQTPDQ